MRLSCPRRPRVRPPLLGACALALAAWAALAGPAAAATAAATAAGEPAYRPSPGTVIRDPYYGDTLFYFYQDRFFTALTDLLVAQHFERLPHHADEAELLRGGLLLSYGMHIEAGRVFNRLIDQGAPPAVRDRAWYYLAKIKYQRGYPADAEAALGRILGTLPPALEEDRALLAGNLRMARGDNAGAIQVLEPLVLHGRGGRYARYNLGVALIRSGDAASVERGLQTLDQLGAGQGSPIATDEGWGSSLFGKHLRSADADAAADASPGDAAGTPGIAQAPDEEAASIADQANLALGFEALRRNQPERARLALQRVRLGGPLADKALLAYGWAKTSLGQPQDALVPWTELASRDLGDAAALESHLAVPYAYEQLNAFAQSLDLYRQAIAVFEREDARLDESIASIQAGHLLEGLIERNPGEEMGWFWNIRELPDMPHASHLTWVFAQHEFQEGFKNWRDLHFLQRNLADWADKLGVYRDMLAARRQGYAERLPAVAAAGGTLDVPALRQRRDALAAELNAAEGAGDGIALADFSERALAARLQRVRETLAHLPPGPETDAARERMRRVEGALIWRLAQAFPERLWDEKKQMRTVDRELDEARQRAADLVAAEHDQPQHFAEFDARIDALEARIRALLPRVAQLQEEQAAVIQAQAVIALQRQKDRLATYSNQARFAVAHIQDQAIIAPETHHEPAK